MVNLHKEFKAVIEDAEQRLLTIPDSFSQQVVSEGKWCVKEIIGHLIDSAVNNHRRIVLAQLSDDLIFPGYEQEDWVKVQRYKSESWHTIIQLWKYYNLHLMHIISIIPEEQLIKERKKHSFHEIGWKKVDKNKPITLEYLITDYFGHLKHHLNQIYSLNLSYV